jgi:hypothetical protein
MKAKLMLLFFLFGSALIYAQWSTSSYNPTLIASDTGEQVLPKVAVHTNGNTYISYYDNSSGGYKLWIKLLTSTGEPAWQNPVQCGGAVFDTWLTDYDLCVDQEGNAIVAFQDIRNGYNSVFAYKVSPTGQQLWGENGLSLSFNATAEAPDMVPVLLTTSDNYTYVAWQHKSQPGTVQVQHLSPQGNPAWAVPITISVIEQTTPTSVTWPQLVETDNNAVILKYFVDVGTSYYPSRYIRAACIGTSGNFLWETAITQTSGISPWTQIIGFQPDGNGGAVLTWHDDRDSDNAYQAFYSHINPSGQLITPIGGAYVSSLTNYQHFYPRVICDPIAQKAQVVMRVTNLGQTQYGVIMQEFDYSGNRLLGDEGLQIESIRTTDYDPLYAWNHDGLFHYIRSVTSSATPMVQRIGAVHNNEAGYYSSWGGNHLALTDTAKLHYDFSPHPDGYVICVWEDGSSNGDIYAQKYWYTGNVGLCNDAPANVTAEVVPPSSVLVTWQAPPFSAPIGYWVQLGDTQVELQPNITQYTFSDVAPGFYHVFVRAIYEGGYINSQGTTITVTEVANEDLVTSAVRLTIAPNPLHSFTKLSWQTARAGYAAVSLYNLRGQKVLSEKLSSVPGDNSFTLDCRDLPAGIYFLRMSTETGVFNKRLVLLP